MSDAAAVALETALLEPLAAESQLGAALLIDPWFCRWAATDCPAAQTIAELARQLAIGLADRLKSLPSQPPCWLRPSVGDAQAFAAQAESIRNQALQLDLLGLSAAASPAFYERLLHAVPDYGSQIVMSDYLLEMPGIDWRLSRLIALVHQPDRCVIDLEQAKLAAMKELAYGASHEINNPLANISGRAQSLLRDEPDPRRRRLLKAIDAQAIRAHEMISDLMLFAHPPALVLEEVDLVQLVNQSVAEMQPIAESQQIELHCETPGEPLTAQLDATQTLVAILALLRNSVEAIGFGGSITIELQGCDEWAEITVTDTGPGVPVEVREHMFDPFYSGREAGRGLGFGLSKCWRIAQLHGGNVELVESGPVGSRFVLRLPIAEREA